MSVAETSAADATTVNLTVLLERAGELPLVRPRRHRPRHRRPQPTELSLLLVALGGVLLVCAFWSLVGLGVARALALV